MLTLLLTISAEFFKNAEAPSVINEVMAVQMMIPSAMKPTRSVIYPPITAEETRVSPRVITRALIVSHKGPILDLRYWQTVSSHAHCRQVRRFLIERMATGM